MGIMFQTFRPSLELGAKGFYLLEKWNKLSNKTRENIIKEVLGDGSKQPRTQIKDELAKAINNASSDQT
jgi:hypothetical protein